MYVSLQMGSLTGFYSIFRLNVNLFLDQPMDETIEYFRNDPRPVRSDIKKKPKLPEILDIKEKKEEKIEEEKIEQEPDNEDLKRKSIANFKRSKSKHIINQYGQIVGKEPMNEEEKLLNNSKILEKSKKKPQTKRESENLAHNIFDPDESIEPSMDDLYGTEKTFEVKHIKHPVLSNRCVSKKLTKQPLDLPVEKKSTMKLTFSKFDVDKAQPNIPDDFEIIFNFRCLEDNKQWISEWEELEQLRNQIIKKLETQPDLGRTMLNGKQ